MIRDLDASLKKMITGEAVPGSELKTATITFSAPDKDWQQQGGGLQLDVYLYRTLDNRELRSNARRQRRNPDGTVTEELFPARVECSYIISAWNKSVEVGGLEKEAQEHRLLSQVLFVLWRNPTMPAQYLVGLLANAEIAPPVVSAESEDMAAKPDFWTAFDTYVRPAITCRITIAMDLKLDVTSHQATTIQTMFDVGEGIVTIGGIVRRAAPPNAPIPNAWIRLDAGPRVVLGSADGSFVIDQVSLGPHTLTVRAVGFQEGVHTIQVPDPSGRYDVPLVPL